MSTKKKNFYEEKNKKKALMGVTSASEENKPTKYKLSHLILGGIGGGLTGILTGRASLLAGLAVTGVGTFLKSPSTAMFGVGLMATGGYQTVTGSLQGVEKDGLEGFKDRLKNFAGNIKHQLFLDKLLPKKKKPADEKEEATNGLSSVQDYAHPGNEVNGGLDFTEANRIERQISESAKEFEAQQQMGEVDGVEGIDGIEDKLY